MVKKEIKRLKNRIKVNKSYEGESIEVKMNRIVNNKEPIEDVAPIIYQPRDEGVKPEYDIRTDRFLIAEQAMTKVAKNKIAQRKTLVPKTQEDNGTAETIQTTES